MKKVTNSNFTPSTLSKELKVVVGQTISLLGEVIKEEGGSALYSQVESIRQQMTSYRSLNEIEKTKVLDQLYKKIKGRNQKQQHLLATSYSLMLELINVCEAAFRTYQIRKKQIYNELPKTDHTIVFVLTAHPTEVRTSDNTIIFDRIQNLVIRLLEGTGEEDYLLSSIKYNLKLAWLIPLTKHKKPQVIDEANHLFSIILRRDILDTLLRINRDVCFMRIRTWVGGDKDGHPGVDERVMTQCLEASRAPIVNFLELYFDEVIEDLNMLGHNEISSQVKALKKTFPRFYKIRSNDYEQILNLKEKIKIFQKQYQDIVGAPNPRLNKMSNLLTLFPALVIPIELREDSGVIKEALHSEKNINISRMLERLKNIAGESGRVRFYAQGLIISMCNTYEDFKNAVALQEKHIGKLDIPVIPLFETAQALEDSCGVVEQMINNRKYQKMVLSRWSKRLEVMLGYSDSSKGMGVFPSRLSIAETMRNLDEFISSRGLTPVFFHGSGGSVDRGGGKLQDQTGWWPKSSLELYKATVQGEMVERYFTSPEVFISNVSKIAINAEKSKGKHGPIKLPAILHELSTLVKQRYSTKLKEPLFLEMVEKATPYSYLNVLKLGSRPTKRSTIKGPLDFSSIRAIPWILCWTQTRLLFPSWWGIGSSWQEMKKSPKKVDALIKAYRTSFLFRSFIRTLGFSLEKVEFSIFKLYLRKSTLSSEMRESIIKEFAKELKLAKNFVRTISGERSLLWHTPWLEDSIKLRSPMIHPLNILQIIGHEQDDPSLVRISVAGISCGMLTTG